MNNQQILEKAIRKSIDGGWTSGKYELDSLRNPPKIKPANGSDNELLQFITDNMLFNMSRDRVIFNHDFAKALWGKSSICNCCQFEAGDKAFSEHDPYCSERTEYSPAYEYHLKQMVISDDPIKYLGENV